MNQSSGKQVGTRQELGPKVCRRFLAVNLGEGGGGRETTVFAAMVLGKANAVVNNVG